MRVLCLDIEGGFGGSSRSLYESLCYIDRNSVAPEVWCRRDGPVRQRYEALGIPCRIVPGLPKMNSLPRWSRNMYGYGRALGALWDWRERSELAIAMRDRFDVVHFNHEGLLLLTSWLRNRHGKAQTMHVRTIIPDNAFGRWQCRAMTAATDELVFITENERANVERLAGHRAAGTVIYNIAMAAQPTPAPHPGIPHDGRFKVAVLSNFAWIRGTDRVVEIAETLAARGRRDVLFVVAGDMRLRGQLPGELGEIGRRGGTLADYAASRRVADMVLMLGHVPEPEPVLAGCEVVLRPTREANPWGRDILEGLASGRPVISIGTYDRFIENDATGFLLEQYDPSRIADILLRLNEDRGLIARLGESAKARIALLCDGSARATDLTDVWKKAIAAREGNRQHV